MALLSSGTHSRSQSVLHFAKYLQHALDQSVADIPALTTHLEALISSPLHGVTHEERFQLHQTGVELWNKCRHDADDESNEHKTLLAQARAFAYLILTRPSEGTSVRAARACIDAEQYSLATSILERISESSSHEYVLLRILLAWKQDKPSIAEFFFMKISSFDAENAREDAISLFYEIGVEYLERGKFEQAKKWLERAYNNLQHYDSQSALNAPELRLNVLHAYTRNLFALGDHDELAREMLETLYADYPQRLPVSLLRMEHYADAKELRATLESTMQTMQLMGSNFKLAMHYVHVLRKLNVTYACKALGSFILKRLAPEGMSDWIEESTLTLIWMITQDYSSYGTPKNMSEAVSILWQARETPPLSPEASQGAIILIWKRIEQAYETDVKVAAKWCKVALMIARHADLNGAQCEAKLSRKFVACCIAAEDYTSGRDVLNNLSDDAKAHHLTRYLAYVIAMRSNDEIMCERALGSLACAPKDADKLLFACVSETEKHGSPTLQAKLLQRILDKYSNEPHPDVNFSALLRATTRLLWQLLEQKKENVDEEILERLCAVLRQAKNYSVKCNGAGGVIGQSFGAFECEWFSKNGYNLALQMMQQWPVKYILRILENITNLKYPKLIPGDVYEQHSQRNKKIAYMRVVLYITEARNGDVTAYTKIMAVYNDTIVKGEHDQIFIPLLPLIFEAALHSNLGDRQNTLNDLLTFLLPESPKSYAACADMVLTSAMASDETHIPIKLAVGLLNRIISQVRTLQGYEIKQASRWIRCLVQLIVDASGKDMGQDDAGIGLAILRDIIDEASQIFQDTTYPAEELEWLATTVFNTAIDLYVAEKDDAGREMALKALPIADAMADKSLACMLREKMRRIGWC